ncbi:hypothetical protein E2C01_027445 [Portunus trituberculatus]|uniref:Uncharacterized protein n=1 Tax=Portunus trituberculatus TaxID=210409 RepID=A0A5B7EI54_PORTR|nr:hypothetical protein [Portunus trituberculatus]
MGLGLAVLVLSWARARLRKGQAPPARHQHVARLCCQGGCLTAGVDVFLSAVVVAASWARCLEETGSAAPRPRRTTGGGVPLPSSPREVPLKAPWGLSLTPRGHAPPNSRLGSGALSVSLNF